MTKIVITRPIAQAQDLQQKLASAGHEAIIFPLLEIAPIEDASVLRNALQHLEQYALAAFVSPNAIHAVFSQLSEWHGTLPIAVMGEGSKKALQSYGIEESNTPIFSPRDPCRTDSETLLEVLDLAALKGKKVVLFRGETGRELLADALRDHGIEVEPIAAYRRLEPVFSATRRAQILDLIEQNPTWLITSSEALRILRSWLRQLNDTEVVAKMQHQHLFVPHIRIAETAHSLGFDHVTLTSSGDAGLLDALQSQL